MFTDDATICGHRVTVCQAAMPVATNSVPLFATWDHLHPRKSEASELSGSAPDSPASHTGGLHIYTKQALDDLVSQILDEDNNQQNSITADGKIITPENHRLNMNSQRVPESFGSDNTWSRDGTDKRSYPYSDHMNMFTLGPKAGHDRDWKVNAVATPLRECPSGAVYPSPFCIISDNQHVGSVPPDTKELMSAALSNSMLWLKNSNSRPVDIASCSATPYTKSIESQPHQALLLAQVHATLQALQANSTTNSKNQLSSSEFIPCMQPLLERSISSRPLERPPDVTAFNSSRRDAPGFMVPNMNYYSPAQCNNVLVRHQPVMTPMGSHLPNESDSTNSSVANFIQPFVPTTAVKRQHWHDNFQSGDMQYTRQGLAAEQFYHNSLQTHMSNASINSCKLTRRLSAVNELSVRLEECYHQLHCLEKEEKHAEAELAQQTPGRIGSNTAFNTCNFATSHRLPHNPTKVDRLIYDSWREHTKVSSLLIRLQQLRDYQHKLHPSIDSAMETWNEGIRKVRARRCEEIIGTANRNHNTSGRIQDDKDILAAVGELLMHTRRARTVLWCAVQMTRGKPNL